GEIDAGGKGGGGGGGERLPSFAVRADYGVIGTNPAQSHGTFSVAGTVRIPIWQGGRTQGETEVAEAALAQRRAEFEDLKGRIESEVRNAYFDLQAAARQVEGGPEDIQIPPENFAPDRARVSRCPN